MFFSDEDEDEDGRNIDFDATSDGSAVHVQPATVTQQPVVQPATVLLPATGPPTRGPPAPKVYKTSNSLEVKFMIGDFVVVGIDVDDFDIARVDGVHEEESMELLQVTYFKADLKKQELLVRKQYRQPWTDTCAINSVIMCLGHDYGLTKEVIQTILSVTRTIYVQLTAFATV